MSHAQLLPVACIRWLVEWQHAAACNRLHMAQHEPLFGCCLCAPVVHDAILLNGQVRVAASVGSCQLAHGGATTLADVVEADGTALGPLYMV